MVEVNLYRENPSLEDQNPSFLSNVAWINHNKSIETQVLLVLAYGAINDPCVFVIFADWRQVALEIDACRTDVTSLGWGGGGDVNGHVNLRHVHNWRRVTRLGWGGDVNVHVNLRHMHKLTSRHWGWGGVGMLTFMLTCVTCTTDVTSLGWGGVGMLTFMLTCVTCTTDVTSLGWGGVGMLTFMLTCVTCTTDVTSLGWGGVGMLTFMLTCVPCTTDVTSLGWGGVGMLTFMLTCVTCTTDVTSLGWGGRRRAKKGRFSVFLSNAVCEEGS